MRSVRYLNRMASDRLDVLEAEQDMPRRVCSVRGCNRSSGWMYEHASAFGHTFWLCSRHRPLYRRHDRIVSDILSL